MPDYGVRNVDWIRGGISRQFDARTWSLEKAGNNYYVLNRDGELLGMLVRGDVPFISKNGKTVDGDIARKAEPVKFAKALKALKERMEEKDFSFSWIEIRTLSFSEQDRIKDELAKKRHLPKKMD